MLAKLNYYKWEKILLPIVFIGPGVLFLLIFIAYPILFSFDISFKNFNLISGINHNQWNGFQNYLFVLKDPIFWTSVKVTMIFSLFTVAFSVVFALGLGLLLAAISIRWRRVLSSLILMLVVISPVVIGMLFRIMFTKNYGIIDYILPLIGWLILLLRYGLQLQLVFGWLFH
jgi:multiple sugar transport system permease protein